MCAWLGWLVDWWVKFVSEHRSVVSKTFDTTFGSVKLFLDITNPLNFKFMYFENSFITSGENPVSDYNDYMASLHLPSSSFSDVTSYEVPYMFIKGNDKPGDFPKDNIQYIPINIVRGNYLLPSPSVMETVIDWVAKSVPSLTVTVAVYEFLVS